MKPFVLGLTGSIGMGKTTTAGFFRDLGCRVWDADAAVHRLYAAGGAAVDGIAGICPDAVSETGVDRRGLRQWMARDPAALAKIETVVHPLVAADRQEFLARARTDDLDIVVVDIPLLFETGGQAQVDATLVVSVPFDVQQARVMQRDGMTEAYFQKILATQMPDAEKRARADYIIETTSPEVAKAGVARVLQDIRKRIANHA